jgi:preprotein translocase subunit YajC
VEILAEILAQTTPAQPQQAPQQPGSAALFLPAMMVALIAFMLLTARSQRKREAREREDLNNRLAKNHRVLTVGGVIGTVVAVKENEVVLKVDESTNTKMTFLRSAVQRILTDDTGATLDGKG